MSFSLYKEGSFDPHSPLRNARRSREEIRILVLILFIELLFDIITDLMNGSYWHLYLYAIAYICNIYLIST